MSANDNRPPKLGLHPDFGDIEIMLNMRNWLSKALELSGATEEGAGMGMGRADVQIAIEGHLFNVEIRPING